MKESDLYQPVKNLFESLGYDVKAEIGDIDVLATKEEDTIVVELKKELNLKLITQGALRQKFCESVYVAIEKPSYKIRGSKNFQDKVFLLKRLGIGLIFVDLTSINQNALIEEDPLIFNLKHAQNLNKKTKTRALKEKSLRSGDYNMGGHKGKKMTAYKENVLLIVGLLYVNNQMKVSEIKLRAGDKTNSILNKNFYGYFQRVERGIYQLTKEGEKAYDEYKYIIDKII